MYDILLDGRNGERLVDFAATNEIKDRKVTNYINSFTGHSRQYDINNVVVRRRDTNEAIEKHDIDGVV